MLLFCVSILFLDRDLDAYLQLAGVIGEATLFCLVKFSLMFVSLGICCVSHGIGISLVVHTVLDCALIFNMGPFTVKHRGAAKGTYAPPPLQPLPPFRITEKTKIEFRLTI